MSLYRSPRVNREDLDRGSEFGRGLERKLPCCVAFGALYKERQNRVVPAVIPNSIRIPPHLHPTVCSSFPLSPFTTFHDVPLIPL